MEIEGLLAAMECAHAEEERAAVHVLIGIARARAADLNRNLDIVNGSIQND